MMSHSHERRKIRTWLICIWRLSAPSSRSRNHTPPQRQTANSTPPPHLSMAYSPHSPPRSWRTDSFLLTCAPWLLPTTSPRSRRSRRLKSSHPSQTCANWHSSRHPARARALCPRARCFSTSLQLNRAYQSPPSSLSSSSSSFVCRSDAFNVQLCVLRVAHFSRRLGEQTRPIRGFWKRNNISNRSRAREHHHQSIEAKRQASVRRRAVLKRLHEIAKFILRLLRRQSNGAKHRLLHVAAVDAQRATANFHAVVHQVVRDRAGVG
mmetsp:Transcript_6037/g.20351  ORF Transcript_6037/g.20351 Transcript_6037/m.20351 type:complete len:265 (-) Transcript_6037:1740-2534(-)